MNLENENIENLFQKVWLETYGRDEYSSSSSITGANTRKGPIVALDTPSGLNLTTGKLYGPITNANATLTLAMPIKGRFVSKAKKVVGELFAGDISVLQELCQEEILGLEPTSNSCFSDVERLN